MRLLETESLEAAFIAGGVSLDLDAQEVYRAAWDLIKSAETSKDADIPGFERQMKDHFRRYFARGDLWIAQQKRQRLAQAGRSARPEDKRGPETLQKPLEKQIERYAVFYMHLHRALTLNRAGFEEIVRLIPADDHPDEKEDKIEGVNDTTLLLLRRAYAQKREFIEKRGRLAALLPVLHPLEKLFGRLRDALPHAFGAALAQRELTAFRAALRHRDFARAQEQAEIWGSRRGGRMIAQTGQEILAHVQQNVMHLRFEGEMILDPSEIRFRESFLKQDEKRIDRFLKKYNLPVMALRFRALLKLAHRLGSIGSLEGLLVLHARLIGGMANGPMTGTQATRHAHQVTGRIAHLIQNGFPDLPPMFDEMERTVQSLQSMFSETRAIYTS